jgi:hypothetical protein
VPYLPLWRSQGRAGSGNLARVVDAGDWSPEEYAAASGMSKSEYEERFLRAARAELLAFVGSQPLDGHVESVEADTHGAGACIVVVFRAHAYAGRRFGWRFPVWPASDPHGLYGSPEEAATLLDVHLGEVINDIAGGAASSPDDNGVEWLVWD